MKYCWLILFFLIISCTNREEQFINKLYGQWAIEEIKYNNVNYKEDLYVNFMAFEKDNKMLIPESIHFPNDIRAEWNVNFNNEKKVSIKCIDEVFNGTYSVKFIKDPGKKLLGIEMKSDSTYIKAFKFLQDYDVNKQNW